MIWYWKAECGQLKLAHVTRNRKKTHKKYPEANKTNASAHLIQYMLRIRESSAEV